MMKQTADDSLNISGSPNESAIKIEVVPDVYQDQPYSRRPYSNAERQRRFRERKKADKMKTCIGKEDNSITVTVPQKSSIHQTQNNIKIKVVADIYKQQTQQPSHRNKKSAQTNAERQRRFRAKRKADRISACTGMEAIYQNVQDCINSVSANMGLQINSVTRFNAAKQNDLGEMCIVECLNEAKQQIIIVNISVSPNQCISNITQFIHKQLLIYTPEGSALFNENYFRLPLILTGDFNINFGSDRAEILISFLQSKLQLKLFDMPEEASNRGTGVDAVFARYLDDIQWVELSTEESS